MLGRLIGNNADPEAFWAAVRSNLNLGRIRLLFVADRIPTEFRRIVEFPNRQMQPAEVLAIELRQYEVQGLKTLVPIVLGQTQDSAQKKASSGRASRPTRVWDEAAILAEIEARTTPGGMTATAAIIDWIRAYADRVAFITNPAWGWMGAEFRKDGIEIPLVRVHVDGTVAVYFEYMLGKPVFDDLGRRQDLLDRTNRYREAVCHPTR